MKLDHHSSEPTNNDAQFPHGTHLVLARLVVALLAAALLLAGCSTSKSATSAPSGDTPLSPTASPPTSDATPSSRVETACSQTAPAGVGIQDATLNASDHVRLNAAVLGTGPRGVVMLHQTDDGICGWFPYASYLAQHGFHVLLFDRRCTGDSTCPPGDKAYRHAADVQSAVTALRHRGARKVVVVGASLGGAVAIGACATVKTNGCAALSPAIFDVTLGDGLTANNAISKVRVPLLVAVAPDDSDSPITDVQTLTRRARPGVVQLIRLPAGTGHGWDTVNDPDDPTRRSAFNTRLVRFLEQHLT